MQKKNHLFCYQNKFPKQVNDILTSNILRKTYLVDFLQMSHECKNDKGTKTLTHQTQNTD